MAKHVADQEPKGIGHNSVGGIAGDQLRSIIEHVERLNEEKKALAEDIREIFAEAKSNGFDAKALRAVIRIRQQDSAERAEQQALVDLYMHALGALADTPLGQSAIARDIGVEAA